MREPNFMMPKRSPARTCVADAARGRRRGAPGCRRSAARRSSGRRDRSRSRCARWPPPASWRYAGRNLPGRVADAGDASRRRDAVDVHVHRRQEDADLLPLARRRDAGLGRRRRPSRGRRPATARRAPASATTRSGSRKKNAKKRAEHDERHARAPSRRAAPATSAISQAPPMNGKPARSRRITAGTRSGRAGGAPARRSSIYPCAWS